LAHSVGPDDFQVTRASTGVYTRFCVGRNGIPGDVQTPARDPHHPCALLLLRAINKAQPKALTEQSNSHLGTDAGSRPSFRLHSPPMIYRSDNRTPDQLRPVKITPDFITTAEGSALIEVGNTRVICTASVEESVPAFMRNSGKGWISSEYGMLPRSTLTRSVRDATKGRASGRTHEIQRLIARSLR